MTDNVATRAREDWKAKIPAIAREIRDDLPLRTACRLHGVSRRTMDDAIKRDDPDLAPIHEARAEIERKLAKRLHSHAEAGTPHGATTFHLERMFPDNWKAADKLELSGPDGAPMQTVTATPTEAELRARLALLAEKLGGGE